MSIQEFNHLVLNNTDGLRPFAISLTRDHEQARDLCQETLCKAFVYRDKYQPGTNIKAWLFTIMRNIFINEYRRSSRKTKVMQTLRYTIPTEAPAADIRWNVKEMNEAIYNLPSIFKTACLLYLEGYKYHEIAEALNEPIGTIKSRIHFARRILKKKVRR